MPMKSETGDDRPCHSRPSPRLSAKTVVHARKDLRAAEKNYSLHIEKQDRAIRDLAHNTDERGLKLLRFMQRDRSAIQANECDLVVPLYKWNVDDKSAQGKSTVKGIEGCELDKVLSKGKLIAPASHTSY